MKNKKPRLLARVGSVQKWTLFYFVVKSNPIVSKYPDEQTRYLLFENTHSGFASLSADLHCSRVYCSHLLRRSEIISSVSIRERSLNF